MQVHNLASEPTLLEAIQQLQKRLELLDKEQKDYIDSKFNYIDSKFKSLPNELLALLKTDANVKLDKTTENSCSQHADSESLTSKKTKHNVLFQLISQLCMTLHEGNVKKNLEEILTKETDYLISTECVELKRSLSNMVTLAIRQLSH